MSKLKNASKIVIVVTTVFIVTVITPGLISLYQYIYTGHSYIDINQTFLSFLLGTAGFFGYFGVVAIEN